MKKLLKKNKHFQTEQLTQIKFDQKGYLEALQEIELLRKQLFPHVFTDSSSRKIQNPIQKKHESLLSHSYIKEAYFPQLEAQLNGERAIANSTNLTQN